MRKTLLAGLLLFCHFGFAQEGWEGKFEQLGTDLPTPNSYRTGSGAPGIDYWQQKADYQIDASLDEETLILSAEETITYYNNSPDELKYLWVQLDQNVREKGNLDEITRNTLINDSIPGKFVATELGAWDYNGGFKISSVKEAGGDALPFTINRTMMRVDLPSPLKSGDNFSFRIKWSYLMYDRMMFNGRGGYEYFPGDGNYAFTLCQWYPRMAVYDDVNGWQNKQFIGNGEFALTFGDFVVNITVPADHVVAATGTLQNGKKVLTKTQYGRLEKAKSSFDQPVLIVTQEEAEENEKERSKKTKTWQFKADNVRDFAFTSSRKYIWDAMAVKLPTTTPLAMSFYPKEGNPLWERESTKAIKNTLEIYSERTFDYPYPVAQSVHAADQGMEYPMICFNYGRPNEDGSYSQTKLEGMVGVIVHEIGHNFFPMIVNSDERQWTWMDEGLNTFLEHETLRIRYPDFDTSWGTPAGVVPYMKGDKRYIRPIMTNSEQIVQFGYNAYGKPSAALVLLRETVMGPELFDRAFKEYALRWKFKRPTPADFFRTMEDASAVDLDWFWRGWFYSVDHVDVGIEQVQWYKMRSGEKNLENREKKAKKGDLSPTANLGYLGFGDVPQPFSLVETPDRFYGEFNNRLDHQTIVNKLADKNFYEIKLANHGGLVTPLILEFTFEDGTKREERIPAEVWRQNEKEITKVFYFDKVVAGIEFDPNAETGDTNPGDNVFPRVDKKSRFDAFKEKAESASNDTDVIGTWAYETETPEDKTSGRFNISREKGELSGTFYSESTGNTYPLKNIDVEGGRLSFEFDLKNGNNSLVINVRVFVVKDQFQGTMQLGEYGAFPMEGYRKPD